MTVIAVIGLGYVGLSLAVEFGKKYKTLGFDLPGQKIAIGKVTAYTEKSSGGERALLSPRAEGMGHVGHGARSAP